MCEWVCVAQLQRNYSAAQPLFAQRIFHLFLLSMLSLRHHHYIGLIGGDGRASSFRHHRILFLDSLFFSFTLCVFNIVATYPSLLFDFNWTIEHDNRHLFELKLKASLSWKCKQTTECWLLEMGVGYARRGRGVGAGWQSRKRERPQANLTTDSDGLDCIVWPSAVIFENNRTMVNSIRHAGTE